MAGGVPAFIEARRSIRAFLPDPVPRAELDRLVEGDRGTRLGRVRGIAPAHEDEGVWQPILRE